MSVKSILVAGAALALCAGAAMAQTQTNPNPPPPAAGQRGAPPPGYGGPGFRGGHDGFRGGGRGRFGRFRHGPRLTPEERQKRLSDAFARMDANHDGRVTFEEFRADLARRKLEREHRMFERFSGGQDSVTLDQLKAREAVRDAQRQDRFRGPPGDRRGPPPAANTPPAR